MVKPKLKPVVFVQGEKRFYASNSYAQNIILKAMSEGITNPKELRKIAGLKATADVYRTLDKMSIRKEYHDALQKNGVDLDYLVRGLKQIADEGATDTVKLSSFNTLLKSLGLEKYEKAEDGGQKWEDVVLAATAEEEKIKELNEGDIIEGHTVETEYEVNEPIIPEDEKIKGEEETEMAKMLYDTD